MSKIKEYYLNGLTEEEMNEVLYQKDLSESEFKDYYISRLRTKILDMKMSSNDHKSDIQKLQQEIDRLVNG